MDNPQKPNQVSLTAGQAMDLAMQHHGAGRLPEAESMYRQILQAYPDQPVAVHLLGVVAHQVGQKEIAVDLISKALAIKPDYLEAHYNLGNVFKEQGRLEDSVACYQKALAIQPDYPEAHNNLGNVFEELGRLDEAVACYRKALAIKPDYLGAHYNLGNAFKELGRLDEAVACYRNALAIKPDYPEAHNSLGIAFEELGRLDEAVACYRKALAIKPDYLEAYERLGLVCITLGHFSESRAAFDQAFRIGHGGPLLDAGKFTEDGCAAISAPTSELATSAFRLRDQIDQLDYLIAKGKIDPSFQLLSDLYGSVLSETESPEESGSDLSLSSRQRERLGPFYNRAVHYVDAPRVDSGALNRSLDFRQIEDSYLSSPMPFTSVDDFLSPEALRSLREFCLESTIYFSHNRNDFVVSRINTGFHCEVLYQLAEELKEKFPRVLGGHNLKTWWAYRHNNQSRGVVAHTDAGAVTFNFWITPDDANLLPDSGGLVVYLKEQPKDWDWGKYNKYKHTEAVSQEIREFLVDSDKVVLPYRENRAVLFNSYLFHQSDKIQFRDGFENRRMNITLLFGNSKG